MNLTLLFNEEFQEASDILDIKYCIHDTINLGSLNKNIKLPDPTMETYGSFVNERYFQNLQPPI